MNLGTGLIIFADVIALLQKEGVLLLDGTFDSTKLDTIQEDVTFGAEVENLLKSHGLNVPEKIDKIIAILPLIAGMID